MIVGCFKNIQWEKNHFTQFGECEGDHSEGWTVQDTLFQLQAQNGVQRNLKFLSELSRELEWHSKASLGSALRYEMIKLISRHIFFKELSFSWVPICHGWPMSTVMSQPHDCFPEVWHLQKEAWIWGSVLASVPEPYREETHQWTLQSLVPAETRGQMDCQLSPSRQAAAEEDIKQRRSSTSGAEVKIDTSARAD